MKWVERPCGHPGWDIQPCVSCTRRETARRARIDDILAIISAWESARWDERGMWKDYQEDFAAVYYEKENPSEEPV